MTTNVFDMTASLMCGDSRWSIKRPTFIAFVDDTGFDKIISLKNDTGNYAFVFAGDAKLIQGWKDWIASTPSDSDDFPPVQNGNVSIAICIANTETSELIFENGQDIRTEKARFAGTGAIHAYDCWSSNSDAMKAVESAKALDVYSGGEVKYLNLKTSENNLRNTSDIKELHEFFVKEGMIMYTNSNPNSERKVVPMKEAAANDPLVKEAMNDIASGKLTASAPCDAMHNTWSAEKVDELKLALRKIFR